MLTAYYWQFNLYYKPDKQVEWNPENRSVKATQPDAMEGVGMAYFGTWSSSLASD